MMTQKQMCENAREHVARLNEQTNFMRVEIVRMYKDRRIDVDKAWGMESDVNKNLNKRTPPLFPDEQTLRNYWASVK